MVGPDAARSQRRPQAQGSPQAPDDHRDGSFSLPWDFPPHNLFVSRKIRAERQEEIRGEIAEGRLKSLQRLHEVRLRGLQPIGAAQVAEHGG